MSVENKNVIEEYEKDKENFKNFTEHKTATFNANSLRRLVLSELSYKGAFKYNRIFGFTRNQIVSMTQYPERYPNHIIRLSRYMYLKSGYYKRLIDYFANSAILNWTIDTEIKQDKMFTTNPKTFRKNYINYTAQVNKFKLDNRVTDIFKRLFIDDACFGFVTENDIDTSIFLLEPDFCKIEKLTNGSIYQFSVNRSLIDANVFKTLPEELQMLIERSKEVSLDNRVMIPYENSFCIKYNDDFTYLYPCFFSLISELLNIDDIKDLVKAKSEADAYKLIYFKIPTNDEDQISMGDELISKFVEMACAILPERFGVIPSPMDLQLIESKSTISDDKNKVEQAVDNYYGEAGVSKALISSASSGSELKLSMKVDSSDIYRIYRKIESWVDLQMKLRGHIYNDYQFVYKIIPVTTFDVDDYVDRQLKLAQASLPNKMKLCSVSGISPAAMLGNTMAENIIFKDIFDSWSPLHSSYTESNNSSNEGGRPNKSETEISDITQNTHDNDGNDPDNRI